MRTFGKYEDIWMYGNLVDVWEHGVYETMGIIRIWESMRTLGVWEHREVWENSPGGTRSENDHMFGPKFGFQNRTLTVQWISMKNRTLTVHFFKNFSPLNAKIFAVCQQNVEFFLQNWPILCQFYKKVGLLSQFPTLYSAVQCSFVICYPYSALAELWKTYP